MTAKTFSRAWLLSPAPESRRQAAWGQRYQAWLAFRRNPLAMAGLIVVVLLLALSLLAPALATRGIKTVALHPGWVRTDMGGDQAALTPHDSVAGLLRVIDGLQAGDSGSFLDWQGQALPW